MPATSDNAKTEQSQEKVLVVVLAPGDPTPRFDFRGPWQSADVVRIQRFIPRAMREQLTKMRLQGRGIKWTTSEQAALSTLTQEHQEQEQTVEQPKVQASTQVEPQTGSKTTSSQPSQVAEDPSQTKASKAQAETKEEPQVLRLSQTKAKAKE